MNKTLEYMLVIFILICNIITFYISVNILIDTKAFWAYLLVVPPLGYTIFFSYILYKMLKN